MALASFYASQKRWENAEGCLSNGDFHRAEESRASGIPRKRLYR